MKKAEHICSTCGAAFFMKESLRNHVCKAEVRGEKKIRVKQPTRKELIEKAKEAGITGADRMSKEELFEVVK